MANRTILPPASSNFTEIFMSLKHSPDSNPCLTPKLREFLFTIAFYEIRGETRPSLLYLAKLSGTRPQGLANRLHTLYSRGYITSKHWRNFALTRKGRAATLNIVKMLQLIIRDIAK